MKYTKQNSKDGLIYYRRRYPDAVRPFIPGKPVEMKRSLKSNDIQSPTALKRYHLAQADYNAAVASASKKRDGAYDTLDSDIIADLATEFENGWRKRANEDWTWTPPDDSGELSVTDMLLDDFGTWKVERDLGGIVDHWTDAAESLLEQRGFVLDPNDPDRLDKLCVALNDAAIRVCVAIQKGTQGELRPEVERPVSGRATGSFQSQGEAFEALVFKVMDLPNVEISPSVRQETSTALRFLKEAFGSPTPAEITRPMVTEWIQLLSQRPREIPKEHRDVPLKKMAEIYKDRLEVERIDVSAM